MRIRHRRDSTGYIGFIRIDLTVLIIKQNSQTGKLTDALKRSLGISYKDQLLLSPDP